MLGIALTTFPHVYHSSKKKNKIARVLILINPTSDFSSLDLFPGSMGERGKRTMIDEVYRTRLPRLRVGLVRSTNVEAYIVETNKSLYLLEKV